MSILKKIKKNINYWPNQFAIIAFLMLLMISYIVTYRIYNIEYNKELLKVKEESFYVKNQLEYIMNHSSSVIKITSFLVEKDMAEKEFERVSKSILEKDKSIDAVQLVKGFTIYKTYPVKGNEKAIGHNLMHDDSHKKAINQAIKKNRIVFEGPIKLVQGGVGIVGREPIYKDKKLWGFAAVLIKMETLLKTIRLNNTGVNKNFEYQIVNKQDDLNGIKFFATKADFKKGIVNETYLNSGDWYLYVKLKEPQYLNKAIEFLIYAIVFSLLIAMYLRKLAEEPIKLKILVEKKTMDLKNLNIELEERAKELTKVNKELEYFAYIISHDLQEPLRMITSFLTQLEKKYNDIIDEKGKQYIFFAVDGAKRMKNIILDILEFSRVGKYNEQKEEVDLNKILLQLEAYYKIQYPTGKLTFPKLPVILCYKSPVNQIFQNLINNAFKYSKSDVAAEIQIEIVEENENRITFAIKDNGIGIEEEYQEKVFVLFQRLHKRKEDAGSGIGLAIVKKIIESLNGSIWLESKINEGSTFYFTLPKK